MVVGGFRSPGEGVGGECKEAGSGLGTLVGHPPPLSPPGGGAWGRNGTWSPFRRMASSHWTTRTPSRSNNFTSLGGAPRGPMGGCRKRGHGKKGQNRTRKRSHKGKKTDEKERRERQINEEGGRWGRTVVIKQLLVCKLEGKNNRHRPFRISLTTTVTFKAMICES